MADENRLEAAFAEARPHLHAVALRLLGSRADADDAVQDVWLRVAGQADTAIENPAGWLTTVVSRICLDKLRGRRRRRHTEPLHQEEDAALSAPNDAEAQQLLVESVGIALLAVLERLTPLERVAFVLHDTFALPFEDIAATIDRSVVATKKLASRARRRVYGPPPSSASLAAHRDVIEAFLTASRTGDLQALVTVLAPDVVRRADPAARHDGAPAELRGAREVAKEIASNASRARSASLLLVDGAPGAVVAPFGKLRFVLKFTLSAGRIVLFEVLGEPQALASVELRLVSAAR